MARPGGYTLIELLAVVAIVSIAAALALPSSHPVAEARADAAATEVALALRFARDEARRTGQPRLFDCRQAANAIAVYGIDDAGPEASASGIPVLHPASGASYNMTLGALPAANTMALISCTFTFVDNASAATLAFDGAGNPVRGLGKAAARTQALRSGSVVLGAGNTRRSITVDGSGRITIS